MPDLSPSLELLRRLGLSAPPASEPVSNDKRRLLDAYASQSQESDPAWKKMGRGMIDVGANVGKGILGIDPNEQYGSPGYNANGATQVLSAMLPLFGKMNMSNLDEVIAPGTKLRMNNYLHGMDEEGLKVNSPERMKKLYGKVDSIFRKEK